LCSINEFQRTWVIEEKPRLISSESKALPYCLAGAPQHLGDFTKMVAVKEAEDQHAASPR
jgi:hypothetical protein